MKWLVLAMAMALPPCVIALVTNVWEVAQPTELIVVNGGEDPIRVTCAHHGQQHESHSKVQPADHCVAPASPGPLS
ncbi:MAG: hypothetical protein ACI9KE_006549 [Polyangiales bacterium]